ncbi:TPA: argininosuccinate lyase, partial [Legionella pneumophila]|nr:argininosuccinate lyase [Legionella pneumophila]
MYTTKRTLKDSLTSFLYPLKSIARCIREGIMTNKTWGGRFKKSLDSRVNQFNASLAFDHVLFDQDINGSQVHVKQLAKQQILTEAESQAIFSALEEIRSEIKQGQYS